MADTESSVHVYRTDTALQLLQLLQKDDSISRLLHIITDGTQNTLWMCTAIESNMEQKRQYTYNVTRWCVRVTSVAVEKHKILHIVSA